MKPGLRFNGSFNNTYFSDTGRSPGVTYYYKVEGAQPSPFHAPYIGTVSNQAGAVTSAGLTATTITTTQINLSWTAASGSVTGYKLYRGTTSGGENTLLYNSTGTSFNDTGLTAGTSYYYTVEAVNGSLISTPSTMSIPDDSERPDWSDWTAN